jgi:ferric-dicitrate binding protein FerR (iron transport regulator)
MPLEEYEAEKRRRLDRLIQETKENQRAFRQLSAVTRQAQLQKALSLTETNPLKRDEAERYCVTMARIQRKYLASRH